MVRPGDGTTEDAVGMKRTPLKRKTPLQAKTSLRAKKPLERGRFKANTKVDADGQPKRRARLKPVNVKRRSAAYRRNYGGPDGEHADRVRAMPCAVRGRLTRAEDACEGRVVAAHEDARGMGGCGGGWADLVHLCVKHHEEAGERRTSARVAFEARYGINLSDLADENARPVMAILVREWERLDGYDKEALYGWVRRQLARELEGLNSLAKHAPNGTLALRVGRRLELFADPDAPTGQELWRILKLCDAVGWLGEEK